MSEAKGPSVVDVLSKVSGISKEEMLKIRERVRDNHARLDACAGPHMFEDVTPEKIVGKEFVCKLCLGRVDSQARAWYERGREHEARRIDETERVLTCAFCGEAYPPGTPESNHEALTAHVKACTKHPMRTVERERDALSAAWARYVDATIDDRDALFAEERGMAGAEEWRARTQKNLAIATAALRDLGVDVNTLLNAKTRTT